MKISPLFNIFFLAFTTIFSIAAAPSIAQIDSKGQDFWLTFPPNFHNNINDNASSERDSLYIFIVADAPAKGEIQYRNRAGTLFTKSFTITDITQIYTFGVSWIDFELRGFNNSGTILGISTPNSISQNERVAPQSFHITSDQNVGVYALDQAQTTSEAFLVLPTDVLGKEYFVVAYNSDGSSSGVGGIAGSSTPSQFALVAAEDNTDITIYPKVPTRNNGSAIQNITLQAGEVYLVQAQISSMDGYRNDLTGTRIVSTKPVALFGGHQRTILPVEEDALFSRDCLIEQMPPLTTWGKHTLLTPYFQAVNSTAIGSDIYRILAAEDSTDVFFNGIKLTTLKKGGVYQGDLNTAAEITSPKPILVIQYKKTSGDNVAGSGTQQYGDPFMMILPPAEQFLSFYRFINAEGYDNQNPSGVYKDYQFATVISPKSVQASVKFDGILVNQSLFKNIGTSDYSYAQIRTFSGAHTVEADSGVGLLVYGYGQANSYGYVGGMGYRPINRKMPDLVLSKECFGNKVIVPGVFEGGNRLASIALDTAIPLENLSVTLPVLPPTRDSAHFRVALQDINRDGTCGIVVTDTLGFEGRTKIDVCGFTVGVGAAGTQLSYLPDNYLINRSVTTGRTKCVDVEVINYGKCRADIQSVRVAAAGVSIIDPASLPTKPFTLDPGQRLPLRLCILALADGDYTDTITIQGACADRHVVALQVKARSDKNPPSITKTGDPCRTTFDVQVTELLDGDSGIEFAEVIDSINCNVQPTAANSDSRGYKITVIDPYQDAFFAVRARDSVGNSTIIRDTIPGFTMQIRSIPQTDQSLYDYGARQAGTFNCDSLEIYNYGAFPLVLEKIVLDINIAFSIPQAQLPFVIPPKESRNLAVCYTPMIVRKVNWFDSLGLPDNDAIGIDYRCLNKRILLKGTPSDILRNGDSRCDLPVYSIANSVPPHYYLEQGYPNPSAANAVHFGFGVPTESDVRIVLTDISGTELSVLVEGHFPAGKYVGGILTQGLLPGVYFYRLTAGGESYSQSIIVE